MGIYSRYRISKPSAYKVPETEIQPLYRRYRRNTFIGVSLAYSLYYVCRLAFSVVKQPLIDEGLLNASQLGIIGSAFLLVYAAGKFVNSFFADYCNIRRFMATGLFISSCVNILLAVFGLLDKAFSLPSFLIMILFSILWGLNGLSQSMGAAPGVISLSRWFPLRERGTWYSLFSATPYIGECISFVLLGFVAKYFGWQACFILSSVFGFIGSLLSLTLISDTPESKGLPSIATLAGEETNKTEDSMSTRSLQTRIFRHWSIWIIAISSGFLYISKYAISGWSVLFMQEERNFPIETASIVTSIYALAGVAGTVLAGWLSDKVFSGNRFRPVLISGILSIISLAVFLFIPGGYLPSVISLSLFSLSTGVLYCLVAGIIAMDIVPRKATGAAVGIIGIVCYVFASLQDLLSGYLIDNFKVAEVYNFLPVSIFWISATILSVAIPLLFWSKLSRK